MSEQGPGPQNTARSKQLIGSRMLPGTGLWPSGRIIPFSFIRGRSISVLPTELGVRREDRSELTSQGRGGPTGSQVLFGLGVVGDVALGMWHGSLALMGLFVFRETEPLSAWVTVGSLLGTLPAALLAFWKPRVATYIYWALAASLLGASALSLASEFEAYESWLSDALSWLARGPGAQALLGAVLWFSRRPGQPE